MDSKYLLNKINKQNIYSTLTNSIVPIMFFVIIVIAIPLSNYSAEYLVSQVVTRLARNAFLVLALLLPIMAGMGINFGMTLGAMAGQIGLFFVTDWQIGGVQGLFLAMIVSTPISILLGAFAGHVLNKAKGREMITSMMLAFFISGVYLFFTLYLCGSIIPFLSKARLILSRGYGVRNALSLSAVHGFDDFFDNIIGKSLAIKTVHFPIFTFLLIALNCLFTVFFRKTKLGQNIYLQNIGTMNVYNGADQAALFAAAALLIGGATVYKATILNALVGTVLFHLMFIVMPAAGKNLTGQAMVGEYFRTFISYAVVTITLILHAWKRAKNKERERQEMRLQSEEK